MAGRTDPAKEQEKGAKRERGEAEKGKNPTGFTLLSLAGPGEMACAFASAVPSGRVSGGVLSSPLGRLVCVAVVSRDVGRSCGGEGVSSRGGVAVRTLVAVAVAERRGALVTVAPDGVVRLGRVPCHAAVSS